MKVKNYLFTNLNSKLNSTINFSAISFKNYNFIKTFFF